MTLDLSSDGSHPSACEGGGSMSEMVQVRGWILLAANKWN